MESPTITLNLERFANLPGRLEKTEAAVRSQSRLIMLAQPHTTHISLPFPLFFSIRATEGYLPSGGGFPPAIRPSPSFFPVKLYLYCISFLIVTYYNDGDNIENSSSSKQ